MGFEFVFKKDEEIEGYHLQYVKGVEPGGEYGVLEIPSSYRGLPVVGILGIDRTTSWRYDPALGGSPQKRPHFKHIIFPNTIGYISGTDPRVQVGRVDKLTLRGWTFRPGWPTKVFGASQPDWPLFLHPTYIKPWEILGRTLVNFAMDVDTVVFEGEEIPPRLFCQVSYRKSAQIKRVVAPKVKIIGEDAFWGNESICEFELPYGLIAIGASALSGTSGLKTIKIPSTVTYIGPWGVAPRRVDRASLRGREWDFEGALLHNNVTQQEIYTIGHSNAAIPSDPEALAKLGKRKDLSWMIADWLKAEDPDAMPVRNYGTVTKRIEELFRWNALVCGANARPKGLWHHINAHKPFVIS